MKKVKNFILILIIIFISNLECKSDVIYIPTEFSFLSASFETIYSLEKKLNSRNTLNYWGGGGFIYSIFPSSNIPVVGLEIAFEPRWYLKKDIYKKSIISAYIGIAYMKLINSHWNDQYIGFTPGIKYTYKFNTQNENCNFMIEPYFSVSRPINMNINDNYWTPTVLTFTIGVRIGLNKMI